MGGVNYHTGETVVIFRCYQRRPQVAELLQQLLDTFLNVLRMVTHA